MEKISKAKFQFVEVGSMQVTGMELMGTGIYACLSKNPNTDECKVHIRYHIKKPDGLVPARPSIVLNKIQAMILRDVLVDIMKHVEDLGLK